MNVFFLLFSLSFITLIDCQNSCQSNQECVEATKCDGYSKLRSELNLIQIGTKDYTTLLNKLKSLVCNKVDRKVCCDIAAGGQTNSNDSDSPSYRPSVEKEECGEVGGHAGFIRGGEDTAIGEFPFLALLGKNRKKKPGIFWSCGGTIVNKWYVISAAHCGPKVDYVRLGEHEVVDPNNFKEVGGRKDCYYYNAVSRGKCERQCGGRCRRRDSSFDCAKNKQNNEVCSEPHQDIAVDVVKTHPQYGNTPIGLAINDIMLVKLSRPAIFNEFVKPVCLPSQLMARYGEPGTRRFDNNLPVVVGWGRTNTAKDNQIKIVSTAKQQKLTAPAVGYSDCIAKYKSAVKFDLSGNLKKDQHLCAGGEQGKDSCKGDSGGPLMAREDELSPWTLVGVVSGGTARCGIGAPGIFTRVTQYDQWIRDNMV